MMLEPAVHMELGTFDADPQQLEAIRHERGSLLLTGRPGTGKTWTLRERFARLIEDGADPERVALVVRSRSAKASARVALLRRLARPLPGLRVLTTHGLANLVLGQAFGELGYAQPPQLLPALDQLQLVRELLAGEDRAEWPAYGHMLGLRGFSDEVRQFLNRAQEALLPPEEISARAEEVGLSGWRELASFYRRYLDVLGDGARVDFAGLLNQAAVVAPEGGPLLDHVMVDDYQEATFAEEALLVGLTTQSLVVAGDLGSHIFSFQGTTDVPLRQFASKVAATHVELVVPHRSTAAVVEAWRTQHVSEENAVVARELRRIHVQEGVPWGDLAVVVRRKGSHVGGLLRALDDASVPRATPEGGLSLLAEPATFPFVLALRWIARPEERDSLVESVLTSELVRLSPATARALIRAAQANGDPPAAALARTDGLTLEETVELNAARDALAEAEAPAERSVLDAFSILWTRLPYSQRLVDGGDSDQGRRDLDAVLALSDAVARAAERPDGSVTAFLELVEAGHEAPELSELPGEGGPDAVRVLTAHGTAGLEFDTVIVAGATEGNFPSLSRPEPMFDLASLEGGRGGQSRWNALRLEDERRLFDVVLTRARRRVLITASDRHGDDALLTARSRFVAERDVPWVEAPVSPFAEPLSVTEAVGTWRRMLASRNGDAAPDAHRAAAVRALLAVGDAPSRWWFQRDWTGTDRPLHDKIRVSFSKLDTLDNCELQYVLSEELGLEGASGYHAWVGHLVHDLIERCENGEIERTEAALVAAAEERWDERQFPSRAVSDTYRRLVVRDMLPRWMREYGATTSSASETRFEFEFDGALVTGRIDRVGPAGSAGSMITDYKTGKATNASKAEENLQLGIYFLAINLSNELAPFRPVKAIELAFLKEVDRRDPDGTIKRISLGMNSAAREEFGAKMTERLRALIAQVRRLLDEEVYRPNAGAQCRYCDFKPLCPLWPEGRELLPLVTA